MMIERTVTLWKCQACGARYETMGEVAPVHLRRPRCDCGTPLEWRGETVRRGGGMRRALVAAALCVSLMGSGVAVAPRALAADLPPEHSGMVLCIGKIINLPLVDIPDEPIEVGLFVSDDFKCVRERIG